MANRVWKKNEIPAGLNHVEQCLVKAPELIFDEHMNDIDNYELELRAFGTAMASIYEVATCNRGCSGGDHILERLCARTYNLGTAAFILMIRGLYDEALNLVRNIGEIGNLVALSDVDNGVHIRGWLAADAKTRLREYSPYKVRILLEKGLSPVVPAPEDWYSEFCESFTHFTPDTKPNRHAADGRNRAGGAYQPDGLKRTMQELTTQITVIAMAVSKAFSLNDHLDAMFKVIPELKAKGK